MAEETNDAAETLGAKEARSVKSSYENLAIQYLSRSRKTLDLRNREPEEQANFYLSAAQIYATLELAHAMRESAGI